MATLEGFNGPVDLMAAYNDDKGFIGLVAASQAGMFVRAGGTWITIAPDNPAFSGMNVIDVDEDAVDLYDKLDSKGQQPTIEQMAAYKVESAEPEEAGTESE